MASAWNFQMSLCRHKWSVKATTLYHANDLELRLGFFKFKACDLNMDLNGFKQLRATNSIICKNSGLSILLHDVISLSDATSYGA